jgi:hypothetical protein
MTDVPDAKSKAEDAAREHAWNWFQYHAGQRQAVFRFYVLMAGAISTAYLTTVSTQTGSLQADSYLFGLLLAVLSFLFWRLDVRSVALIKLAEGYIALEETRLARLLGDVDDILFVSKADNRSQVPYLYRFTYSFRQIYQFVFAVVGLIGIYIFFFGAHSPIRAGIAHVVRAIGLACGTG